MNTERKEFIIRCLNAAANLYGVLSYPEFIRIYDGYAATRPAPVSDPLTAAEIDEIMSLPLPDDLDLDSEEIWFTRCVVTAVPFVVSRLGFLISQDDSNETADEHAVRAEIAEFAVSTPRILPEDDFLVYEEPKAFEETAVTKKFARYLQSQHGFDEDADISVWDLQEEIRYAPSMRGALISARNTLRLEIRDRPAFEKLVSALTPLLRNTRTWDYRGHTERELVEAHVLDEYEPINGQDIFDWFMDDLNGGATPDDESATLEDEGEQDWQEDAWDTGRLSDDELESILPPAEYPVVPVDFTFVKDRVKREQVLIDYENVRNVTADFVRDIVIPQLTDKARRAAARRLGFKTPLSNNHDILAGDFGAMLDDQDGEPLIRRILSHPEKLSKYHQLGARYYANYRYAWLVVEAVKVGVGLKCRDLLSGQELFLMEMGFSQTPNVKGMTVCAGIAPMGDVYLNLGALQPADFESSAVVHRLVRQQLGLPLDGPLELSTADQARFAAETIRRIDKAGSFDHIEYGDT